MDLTGETLPPYRIDQRDNAWDESFVGKCIQRQLHFFCNSHLPFYRSNIDRFLLSVAGRLPRSLGMRTGGWDDATVDARMIIGVEPSRALGAVIGTITETSTLRHCGRGRAQQQRHC